MRLTSKFYIDALLSRVFAQGGFGAIERKGAEQAGAIFIKTRSRLGLISLYGPAPQANYDIQDLQERAFQTLISEQNEDEISARLQKEINFDFDLWVIELELHGTSPLETFIQLSV